MVIDLALLLVLVLSEVLVCSCVVDIFADFRWKYSRIGDDLLYFRRISVERLFFPLEMYNGVQFPTGS